MMRACRTNSSVRNLLPMVVMAAAWLGCGDIELEADDPGLGINGIVKSHCEYEGKKYAPGDSFPAPDGCNTCGCNPDGTVACTAMFCEADAGTNGGTCSWNGTVYQPGDSVPSPDGCNTCGCNPDGSITCTAMYCDTDAGVGGGACTAAFCDADAGSGGSSATCTWNGVVYKAGDSIPAGDGCNTCGCNPDGTVACTAMACSP